MGPLSLTLSQQLRLRRTYGSSAYNESTKEFRVELAASETTPRAITLLIEELHAAPAVA
jgi:hypothetical protein